MSLTSLFTLLGIAVALSTETNRTDLGNSTLISYANRLNVTQYKECLGLTVEHPVYSLFDSGDNLYLFTNSSSVTNDTLVFQCLEDQQVETQLFVSLSDTFLEEDDVVEEVISDLLDWESHTLFYFNVPSSDQDQTQQKPSTEEFHFEEDPTGVLVNGFYDSKTCQSGGSVQMKTYFPQGCKVLTSKSYKSANAQNNTNRRVNMSFYPHHRCSDGAVQRAIASGALCACVLRNVFSVQAKYQ